MKDYTSPELEIIKYEVRDCLATSNDDGGIGKDRNDLDDLV